jgi:hypothetical protein
VEARTYALSGSSSFGTRRLSAHSSIGVAGRKPTALSRAARKAVSWLMTSSAQARRVVASRLILTRLPFVPYTPT